MSNSVHFELDTSTGDSVPPSVCLIQYKGLLTQEAYEMLLERVEEAIVQRTEDRRPFRAFVEALQNVFKHGDVSQPVSIWVGGHTVCATPVFRFVTQNIVGHDRVETLVNRLENLEKYDAMETRAALRKQLEQGEFGDRGGAGLGLLTLQTVAVRPLEITLLDSAGGKVLELIVDVASQG